MSRYHQISIYANNKEFKEKIKNYAEQQDESLSELTRRLWRNEIQGWDEEADNQ